MNHVNFVVKLILYLKKMIMIVVQSGPVFFNLKVFMKFFIVCIVGMNIGIMMRVLFLKNK